MAGTFKGTEYPKKKQLEDAEIIKSIRSMKLNSRELLVVLDKIQNGTAVFFRI